MSHRSSRSSATRGDEEDVDRSNAGHVKRERAQSSSSSSSSAGVQKQRRKASDARNDAPEVDEDSLRPQVFRVDKGDLDDVVNPPLSAYEKQIVKWQNLSSDAKAVCIKTVVRFLVMKGARKESVTRAHISDCLGKVDSNYKKHLDMVLVESQKVLNENFGYTVTTGDEVRGCEGKKELLYVCNNLKSPLLLTTLSNLAEEEAAFTGFSFAIFQILFTSTGKAADAKSILQKIRKLDSRFPETLLGKGKDNANRRANPVPELKEDFLGLMDIMKRRGYVSAVKDEKEPDDPGKVVYTLDTRFAVDVGKRRLMRAYFATLGQDMDIGLLQEFKDEEAADEKMRADEEDGEEEN